MIRSVDQCSIFLFCKEKFLMVIFLIGKFFLGVQKIFGMHFLYLACINIFMYVYSYIALI